ncbi:MAG: hypothetical protein ACYST2_06590 [Planctomycetota bacterium]|jgi:beta-lactamase superfamily II metal-dependent hydrolase
MVIPHHGSITTLNENFVSYTDAKVHVCSCDRRQFDRRESRNENNEAVWFYTARDGAIEITVCAKGDIKIRPLTAGKLIQR